MKARYVVGVVLLFGLVFVLSASSWAGQNGTEIGTPGDGFIDLYIDVWPGWPGLPQPPVDDGLGGSWIDADGTSINGFVLQSAAGIFDGPDPAILTGLFQNDSDIMVSDGFIVPPLTADRYLDDIFRQSILPASGPAECWTPDEFLADLTVTYTIQGSPGTFYGDIILGPCEPDDECQPPELGALPTQLVRSGELAQFLVTATDPDAGDVLTFSLDPTLPAITNPVAASATIDPVTGQLRWQVPLGQPVGSLFDAGVVVTDSCVDPGPLSDTGVLTFEIIPEPGTMVMLVSGALLSLGLVWRRRRK